MAPCLAAVILLESIYPSIHLSILTSILSSIHSFLPFFLPWLPLSSLALAHILDCPSWGHTGAGCSGSEDPASNFQPKFFHGQLKPIIRMPMLCSSLSVLCPPACSSSQCAQRERASVLQLLEVSMGTPSGGQLDACRGPEPSFPPQLLVLCPCPVSPGCVSSCLPWRFEMSIPCSQSHPRCDRLHPLVLIAVGAHCPQPHR